MLPPGDLTVIVNTGDDLELHGLAVMPDHDTVVYTLAGLADPVQGWGLAGETYAAAAMLERYGQPTWFRLGDRDLATHVVRTARLRAGERLTTVCLGLQAALGLAGPVLPMSDDPIRTRVRTDDGWLDFQDYFVRLHQAPEVREVRFDGAATASASPEVIAALGAAEAIVIAPSNPIVSIEPILAVPGIAGRPRPRPPAGRADRRHLTHRRRPRPEGAGRSHAALPWRRRPARSGSPPRYVGLADAFVIDEADRDLGPSDRRARPAGPRDRHDHGR